MSCERTLKDSLAYLKNKGVRITPQRHAILEYMVQSMAHPTADEIYKALEERFPNMSVATVYNNLRAFIDAGLVKELKFGDASSRFDYLKDVHYHIICSECGLMIDFDYDICVDVEKAAAEFSGFEITNHRLEFYGICPECQVKKELKHVN